MHNKFLRANKCILILILIGLQIDDSGGLVHLWDTVTSGSGNVASHVTLQEDGNLVLVDVSGGVIWTSNSPMDQPFYAIIRNNGKFVIRNTAEEDKWIAE